MYTRIASIIRKEFIQIGRDPRTLAIVLAMPVMQLFLFAYAINTVVDHLPTIVYDESGDSNSRRLVAAFSNSGYFDVTRVAYSREEAMSAIDRGDAKVALVISPEFGANVTRGETALAQLVVDGSDPNVAQTAVFAAGTITQVRSGEVTAALMDRLGRAIGGGPTAAIEVRPVILYNPGMTSVTFMIPGLIGLILQFQTLILTAFAIVRERERGTLEQLVVTPIRPWELMLGKLLPYVVTAFAAVAAAIGVGRFWFGVEIAGSLWLLIALSLLFILGSLGVGMLVSTVSETQTQAMQVSIFILLPSILLSGFMFPREGMPWIIQQIGMLIPLTYFLQILRGIMLKGVGADVLWPQIVPLAVFGFAVFALSAARFQKRLG